MKKSILFLAVALLSQFYFQVNAQKASKLPENSRNITIDVNQVKGPFNTMFKECIGAGRANEGLRADWQRQLKYVKKECDFKYIRFHGLLTDDMGVYFEDKNGNPIYNFQYIDELFDFLLSINIKPFVELGFMPNALASGNHPMFWWKGNVTPPKDYKKWGDFIKSLVKHWEQRYGKSEVATWYFEVWNEPNLKNLFFTGDQADYFKMYHTAASVIKEVDASYKVGGPATAGSAWIPEFIEYCAKNNAPVDFVSTHTYGVSQGFVDPDGSTGTVLSHDPNAIFGEVIRSRKQITESAKPNLELHYTEWSSSYTPTDPIHDSYHQAAYVLDKLKNSGTAPNSMSYWVFTDIFEENGPRFSPFHGGFGLLNYQDINKPAFYSYQFLNKMGKNELKNADPASWACTDDKGNIQLLFWNFTTTFPADSVNNQVYYKRDLPSKDAGKVKLSLNNAATGKYMLEVTKVGYKSNDAYGAYMELGSPQQLTKEQVCYVKSKSSGTPESKTIIDVAAGKPLEFEYPIRENDVYFIRLIKVQ